MKTNSQRRTLLDVGGGVVGAIAVGHLMSLLVRLGTFQDATSLLTVLLFLSADTIVLWVYRLVIPNNDRGTSWIAVSFVQVPWR